jgi:hypothetical protein
MDTKKCIGPCYKKGERVVHPVTYAVVTDNYQNFCPVNPWKTKASGHVYTTTGCTYKKDSNTDQKDKKRIDCINQRIDFDPSSFLKIYYHIDGLDLAILWYNENPTVSYSTIKRIMDCAIKVYGITEFYEKESSDMINEFTKFIILNYWLKTYETSLIRWFDFKYDINKYIMQVRNEQNITSLDYNDEMYKMLHDQVELLLTEKLLINIHKTFVIIYKDKWDSIESHFSKLKKTTYYILKRKLFDAFVI